MIIWFIDFENIKKSFISCVNNSSHSQWNIVELYLKIEAHAESLAN